MHAWIARSHLLLDFLHLLSIFLDSAGIAVQWHCNILQTGDTLVHLHTSCPVVKYAIGTFAGHGVYLS